MAKDPDRLSDGLTDREMKALELTEKLADILHDICFDPGFYVPSSQAADPEWARLDWDELVFPLHHIQRALMAQAGARSHPKLYRVLGTKRK